MNNKSHKSTNQKFADQVLADSTQIVKEGFNKPLEGSIQWIGSFFVLLSGVILYLDKIVGYFNLQSELPKKTYNQNYLKNLLKLVGIYQCFYGIFLKPYHHYY